MPQSQATAKNLSKMSKSCWFNEHNFQIPKYSNTGFIVLTEDNKFLIFLRIFSALFKF